MSSLTGRAVMRKEPRYENKSLRDLCKHAPCHLNITGCTGGTNPDYPSVPAHGNWAADGKGVGLKSHDVIVIPACPQCHFQLDTGTMLTTEQKKEVFYNGWRRWLIHLLTSGKVRLQVL